MNPDSMVDTAALIRAAMTDAALDVIEADELSRTHVRPKILKLIADRRREVV